MSSFGPSVVEVPSPVLDALTAPVVPLPVLVPGSAVVLDSAAVLVLDATAVVPELSVCPCVAPLVVGSVSLVAVPVPVPVPPVVSVPAVPVAVTPVVVD